MQSSPNSADCSPKRILLFYCETFLIFREEQRTKTFEKDKLSKVFYLSGWKRQHTGRNYKHLYY